MADNKELSNVLSCADRRLSGDTGDAGRAASVATNGRCVPNSFSSAEGATTTSLAVLVCLRLSGLALLWLTVGETDEEF